MTKNERRYDRLTGRYAAVPSIDLTEGRPQLRPLYCGECGTLMHKYSGITTVDICPYGHEVTFRNRSSIRRINLGYLFSDEEHVDDDLDS